ncbi:ribosome maturation factor RimP [Micrococcoides hystricis]|uniref:Ribosome maturation factor RimP n=1 Tax=Micrococcoides hystricis TaxID=1572761 RepID=A0ABV6P8U1_9MICC
MQQLENIINTVVSEFRLITEEVALRQHGNARTLSVVVDKETGTDQVDLDTIAELTHALSAALDAQWDDQNPYELEVSSRGVSRPLTEPRHYRRNIGRLVAITTVDGQKKQYRLISADEQTVMVAEQLPPPKKGMKAKTGPETTLAYDQIAKAKVQVEFSAAE